LYFPYVREEEEEEDMEMDEHTITTDDVEF